MKGVQVLSGDYVSGSGRVPEIMAPSPLCIAVRRVLRIHTYAVIRYPTPSGWHYQIEKVML
jgi:hypothetical protein